MKIIKINFRKLKFIVCNTFKASTQTGKVFIYRLYFIFIACFHIFTYECNQYCARLRYFYLRVSWSFWNSVSFLFWNDWIRNRISNMTALSLSIWLQKFRSSLCLLRKGAVTILNFGFLAIRKKTGIWTKFLNMTAISLII